MYVGAISKNKSRSTTRAPYFSPAVLKLTCKVRPSKNAFIFALPHTSHEINRASNNNLSLL